MTVNNSNSMNQDIYINASRVLANPSNYASSGTQQSGGNDNSAYNINISPSLSTRATDIYQNEINNTNQAMAVNQTATNAMQKQSDILNNIKDSLQKATDTKTSDSNRQNLLQDIQNQLKNFDAIAQNTTYNGANLLQNSATNNGASQATQYQVGLGVGQTVQIPSLQSNTQGLNLTDLLNQNPATFTTQSAQNFLNSVNNASNQLNSNITNFQQTQNQLTDTRTNLLAQRQATTNVTNLFTDNSQSFTDFSKQNIFSIAGSMGLSQANLNPDIVAKLLN